MSPRDATATHARADFGTRTLDRPSPRVGTAPVHTGRPGYRQRRPTVTTPGVGLGAADAPQPFGEYCLRGEYHRALSKSWPYYPVYVEKMRRVRQFLLGKQDLRILDVGCGEGLIVEEYRRKGYDMTGLDLNFASPSVTLGSILEMPFDNESLDIILCLDVLEHLNLLDQQPAISEMHRVLKPGGVLLATIPNLAHFASRLRFLSIGKLIRTSEVERHPGDRPYSEHRALLGQHFVIENERGLFPTYPMLALLTYLIPAKVVWLHRIYNRFFAYPPWCFLNMFECRKISR